MNDHPVVSNMELYDYPEKPKFLGYCYYCGCEVNEGYKVIDGEIWCDHCATMKEIEEAELRGEVYKV